MPSEDVCKVGENEVFTIMTIALDVHPSAGKEQKTRAALHADNSFCVNNLETRLVILLCLQMKNDSLGRMTRMRSNLRGPTPEHASNGAMNFMPRMGLVDYDDDDEDDDLVKGGEYHRNTVCCP